MKNNAQLVEDIINRKNVISGLESLACGYKNPHFTKEDIIQEMLLNITRWLYANLNKDSDIKNIEAYIFIIALNTCRRLLRKAIRYNRESARVSEASDYFINDAYYEQDLCVIHSYLINNEYLLTKKERLLVDVLYNNPDLICQSQEELAKTLGISRKTIYRTFNKINSIFPNFI